MIDDSRDPIGYERPDDEPRRGDRKGAQRHAEGSQGPTAREALREQLQSGAAGDPPARREHHDADARHRLADDREQHDDAELNSEKNRLDRDVDGYERTRR